MEGEEIRKIFDGRLPGVPLFICPRRPRATRGLWLNLPLRPDGIDEVLRLLADLEEKGGGVDAVVFGGLGQSMEDLETWSKWLARWVNRGDPELVVETKGLTCEARRRLINETIRHAVLERRRDPMGRIWKRCQSWLKWR